MSLTLEDLAPRIKQIREKKQQEKADQFRSQVTVAEKLRELQADPRWDTYVYHIDALRQNYERAQKGHEQALAGNEFMGPERYGKAKVDLAEAKGAARALALAIEMVTTLIKRGDAALEELERLTKQTV